MPDHTIDHAYVLLATTLVFAAKWLDRAYLTALVIHHTMKLLMEHAARSHDGHCRVRHIFRVQQLYTEELR